MEKRKTLYVEMVNGKKFWFEGEEALGLFRQTNLTSRYLELTKTEESGSKVWLRINKDQIAYIEYREWEE